MSLTATSKDIQTNTDREAVQTPLELVQDNSDSMTTPASSTKLEVIENSQNQENLSDMDQQSPEQQRLQDNVASQLSAIMNDIEDDLYNRDGDTNDSEMAGERLKNMSALLSSSFANAASSGLLLLREVAIEKKDRAKREEAQINFQNDRDEKKEKQAEQAQDDFENGVGKISKSLTEVDRNGILKDWDQRSFAFGDVDIDAEGWDNIMEIMKDPKKRKAALSKIGAEKGWTQQEIDDAEKDLYEASKIVERIKHGEATQNDVNRLNEIGRNNPKALEAAKEMSVTNAATIMLKADNNEASTEELQKLEEISTQNPSAVEMAKELSSTTRSFREGDIVNNSTDLTSVYNANAALKLPEPQTTNLPTLIANNQAPLPQKAPMLSAEI